MGFAKYLFLLCLYMGMVQNWAPGKRHGVEKKHHLIYRLRRFQFWHLPCGGEKHHAMIIGAIFQFCSWKNQHNVGLFGDVAPVTVPFVGRFWNHWHFGNLIWQWAHLPPPFTPFPFFSKDGATMEMILPCLADTNTNLGECLVNMASIFPTVRHG